MKKMFAGIFIAASAAPLALILGGLAFRHMLGGFPNAMDVAINTAACVLGGGLFVFMAGLVSKGEMPKPVSNGDGWAKK
ncbi:hypothetical protein [Pseudomonas nitroreducens]|uniref:hypothetical protein n=1 Tax=Pseudomonas nitroreducens TaxID=46680 RepID=UPI002D7F8F37|nr:hypothetical protein [Pseudomonas nitroreducens]